MVKIISDSTCDLSEEIIEKYDISILPLHVLLGDEEYLDGVNIRPYEIYKWSDEHETTPRTSAPSIEDAVKMFEPYINSEDEIVCFAISKEMSTSYNVMKLAADELDALEKVQVIDSANLSTGVGHLVVEAAIKAQEGESAEQIAAYIESIKDRVRASFVVDTLTYLHRGGRCSTVAALAGGVLKIHPKIVVENGKMGVAKKYRGKVETAIMTYVKDMEEEYVKAKKDRVFITHSGCDEETIQEVYSYLDSLKLFKEIHITRAGGVISSHCGYGTLGVLYITE